MIAQTGHTSYGRHVGRIEVGEPPELLMFDHPDMPPVVDACEPAHTWFMAMGLYGTCGRHRGEESKGLMVRRPRQ